MTMCVCIQVDLYIYNYASLCVLGLEEFDFYTLLMLTGNINNDIFNSEVPKLWDMLP